MSRTGTAMATMQPILPGIPRNAAVREVLRLIAPVREGVDVVLVRLPTITEREMIQTRRDELDSALVPTSSSAQAKTMLRTILATWLGGYPGIAFADASGLADSYEITLQPMPLWALNKAINAISANEIMVNDPRRGRIPLDPDRPPSAIRVRSIAQGYIDDHQHERGLIDMALQGRRVIAPPIADAERARVAAGLIAESARLKSLSTDDVELIERKERIDRQARECNQRVILDEWAQIGEEPVYSEGVLISPSLLKTLQK